VTPGLRIGKYEVGVRLGKGSFGVVHLARDVELGREVAIKFLRPEFGAREQIVQRFLQEARAAAKIGHPGIVTVFECGVVAGTGRHDGTAYIVMERLLGESLGDRVQTKHAWTYQTIVAIGRQLALALKAAHDSGIIHRDLKPDNVFLVPDAAVVGGERAKILDFGIAKLDDPGPAGMHTHSKMILGTPRYMSPEQARSSTNVDARTDIYALGCIFYELVTGRTPFEGDTGDILFHHQATEVPPITTLVDNAPAKLDALLRQMLEKKPDKRPASMQAVDTALAAIDADAVRPAVRNRARFVSGPVTTDVAEPPRPKRISAAGELSAKVVEDKPPTRDTGRSDFERVEVDLDAVPSPSEEHTAPSQKLVQLMRASEPTFRVVRDDVFEHAAPTDRDVRLPANSTLRTQRSTNVVWFAAAGGVLLLLALVMIVRCSGGGSTRAVTTPPDAAAPTPDAVVDEDRLALDKECTDARAKRAWGKLDRCGRELSKISPEAGKQLLDLAFAESRAEHELRALVSATTDLADATARARAIPSTSTYHADAMTELARVRKAYLEQQLGALAGYAEAHDCEAHGDVVTAIESAHGKPLRDEIERAAQPCTPAAQPPDPQQVRPVRKPPKPVTVKEADPPKATPCADPAAIADAERKGDDANVRGSYAAALALYEVAFRCRPSVAQKAYLAACRARNFPKARAYYRMVGKESLAQICMKEGFDPR
jgi:serine/threonine protein kinase